MLKFHERLADMQDNIPEGSQPQEKRLKLDSCGAVRIRKKGMPRQTHVIPELPVIPWEDPRDRYENRLIMWMNRR